VSSALLGGRREKKKTPNLRGGGLRIFPAKNVKGKGGHLSRGNFQKKKKKKVDHSIKKKKEGEGRIHSSLRMYEGKKGKCKRI